jgi:PPOX class probable F420-dependent enzyme
VTWHTDPRILEAPVARLATVRRDGAPHVVPITFAVVGGRVASVVDGKPKSTSALRRLDNIAAHPAVAVLVDHYDDDWSRLWWIRLDGRAAIVTDGPDHDAAVAALRAKYRPYRDGVAADGPAILVDVVDVREWSAVR